jgi:hypothetical protein
MSTTQVSMTGLAKKWDNIIKSLPEFKDAADAASVEELKKIIVTSEGNIFTIEKEMEADSKLAGAKEIMKDLSEPYRDAKKTQQAKIQYALLLLEGKGVDLNNTDDKE